MPVPEAYKFNRPVLEICDEAEGIWDYSQIWVQLIERFGLTEADLREMTRGGKEVQVKSCSYLATSRLKKAGLLESQSEANFALPGRGGSFSPIIRAIFGMSI